MPRVERDEIQRFLRDFDDIVARRKSLRKFHEEGTAEQRKANTGSVARRYAPPERDRYSAMFDNERDDGRRPWE